MVKKVFILWMSCMILTPALLSGCGKEKAGPPPVPEVIVSTVHLQKLDITTELTGRTSPNQISEVRPQVGGIIQKRFFTEGSDVKAGQVLYKIDPATYQAALDNARAAQGRSEANLPAIRLKASRLKELLVEKAVSQQDYDDAAAALNQAEADSRYWKAMVETAAINLKYTSITAPISGRIGRSTVTEGALVTANQPAPLATIQRLDPMYVDVQQSTADLLKYRARTEQGILTRNGRTKVRIVLEDNSVYPLEGVLQFRDVTVDPTTGSVMLRVIVPNPKGHLLPGMFVRAVVEEGTVRNAMLIPQEGVSRTPKGEAYALILDAQGKVQQRMLVLIREIGNKWLVESGLSEGDRLIVEGLQRVKPGGPAKIASAAPAEANASEKRAASVPAASK